jgi:glycogenin glucosyltransferase
MKDEKKAYVTLISGNSMVIGAIVLWQSWKESHSKFPFCALVTDNVSSENIVLLESIGMPIVIRPMLMMPKNIFEYDARCDLPCLMNWVGAWSKMHLFGLTQFSKIVYLDQDMIIRQNADSLFDYPDMSAVKDDGCSGREYWLDPKDRTSIFPNGGLMVIEPKKGRFERMNALAEDILPSFPLNDQSIWVYFDQDWPWEDAKHIDPAYNWVPMHHSFGDEEGEIIHYVFLKPWANPKDAKSGNPLVDSTNSEWWSFFDKIDLRAKERCGCWRRGIGPMGFLSDVQRNYRG